jgi:hypothetical protein
MRLAHKERHPLSSIVAYLTKSNQFQHLTSLSELADKIPLAVNESERRAGGLSEIIKDNYFILQLQ